MRVDPVLAAPTPSRARRAPSLERRLPLLMAGVLAVVLVTALAVTYVTLARSAQADAEERLQRAARQVAVLAETSIRQGRGRYRAVAADSAVRRALRAAAGAGGAGRTVPDSLVRRALARLTAPTDSGMPVELWTTAGRRVAFVGTDLRADVRVRTGEGEAPEEDTPGAREIPVPHEGLGGLPRTDSLQLGALYAAAGRVYYWVVIPVRDRGTPLGYLVQQRRLAGGDQIDRTIRELSGDSVTAYYRNADGDFWSTLSGTPATPPRRDAGARGVSLARAGLGPVLSAEAPVRGTPLVVVFELARQRVFAAPRSAVLTLAGISLALLGVGAALAWAVSRRITAPIVSLTGAAAAIARGEYDVRAGASGDDEIARLAESFNHMAHEVAAARAALERRSSEARATAEALSRSNAELVTAREAAEGASRAKSAFLATMSHELRTPLNAIGGYTELLEMGLRGPVTDAQRRDLDRIRVSQQHLLGLVSAILDMSRIERGQVAYRVAPVVLAPVVTELGALVGPQAAATGLALEHVPGPPGLSAMADQEKLRQILLNLLSNAIRCTPPGGSVTVETEARDASTVEIRVVDTGIGIPAERHEQIFEPFVQLDRSLSRIREGVGLGLAISRDLARGMGGDLTVESRIDQGSCFTLTLPRAADATDSEESLAVPGERSADPDASR